MAAGRILGSLRDRVRNVYNNFFFDEDAAPAPRRQEEAYPVEPYSQQPAAQPAQQFEAPAPQTGVYQQPAAQTYQPQQPVYQPPQQPVYQPAAYQPPVQPGYQQPQQPGYQPKVYQNQTYAAQPEPQPRNRRAQHAQQDGNNVVDFNAYQHGQGGYNPAAQQGQRFQQAPAEGQGAPAMPAAPAAAASTRIINARGMGEVRSAITLLRGGDSVLIVLENVSDPAEMRRLVDTLSGACYSLVATITKVSRYGVYLLAPQTVAVYADQTTNQMNGMPARQPVRPAYAPQRPAGYPQQPGAQAGAPAGYANPYMNPQTFAQRTAAPMEAAQPFYTRPAPAAAQAPAFSSQAAGDGYAPDDSAAAQ